MSVQALQPHDAAVIDIGSNSVRLVIFRVDGRAFIPTMNEKVSAGLGADLARTGRLSATGAQSAAFALRRFAAIVRDLGVERIFPVATAAVRGAADGPDFIARVRAESGLSIRVLSVEDEARLSALGVVAGAPEAKGVVGDLGGFSLELIEVAPGRAFGPAQSFALGHLALGAGGAYDYSAVVGAADAVLAKAEALNGRGGAFYAVGGAWRALARIDIALSHHPLGVLHHHEITRARLAGVVELTRRQSRRSLELLGGAAASRAASLPFAAAVLERVMHWGAFSHVIVSANGLREGVLIEGMDVAALGADPLHAAAEALGAQDPRVRAFAVALADWIEPACAILPDLYTHPRDRTLRGAAARLVEFGAAFHPDQREAVMFDYVLRAPLTALSHDERAFIAASIHHRYTRAAPKGAQAYERLLTEEARRAGAAVGALIRLGATVAGRAASLLSRFRLSIEHGALVLRVERDWRFLVGDAVRRRLEVAAELLGLAAELREV